MGTTIYEKGAVQARIFAGPARGDGGDRRMIQIGNGAAYVQVYPDDLAAIAKAAAAELEAEPNLDQLVVAFCSQCNGWTMVCTPTSPNRAAWSKSAMEVGDRVSFVDADEWSDIAADRGACKGCL